MSASSAATKSRLLRSRQRNESSEKLSSRDERRDLAWLSLPSHIQLTIAGTLDGKSLAKLLCTCKSWRLILTAEDDQAVARIWQSLCKKFFDPAQYALHAAYARRVAGGQPKTDAHFCWRKLYYSAQDLNSITWWPDGGKLLKASISAVVEAVSGSSTVRGANRDSGASSDSGSPPSLNPQDFGRAGRAFHEARGRKRLSPGSTAHDELPEAVTNVLARVGHSSVVVKDLQVIVGGLSVGGEALIDVVVIDHTHLTLSRPIVQCASNCLAPPPRLRHTTTLITPTSEGHPRLLLIGGYNMEGMEFGAEETYTLTILDGGKRVIWTPIRTTGEVPSMRFHHTADSLHDGQQVLLYGGEGSQVEDFVFQGPEPELRLPGSASTMSSLPVTSRDPAEAPKATAAVVIYLLDVATLVWRKMPTTGPGPGPRSLHQSAIHKCTRTGHDRLVVVSGFSEKRVMDMKAYALDLVTLQWTCKPWSRWEDLPPPRHRSASVKFGPNMLLFVGGASPNLEFLNDVLALDMRSLTWTQLTVQSTQRVYESKMRTSGHTFNGLLVYGGCVGCPTGIIPIPRLDLLLIGSWAASLKKEVSC